MYVAEGQDMRAADLAHRLHQQTDRRAVALGANFRLPESAVGLCSWGDLWVAGVLGCWGSG